MTRHRFPLLCLPLLLAPALAGAAQIPFSVSNDVRTAFGGANTVHAADVDGDGDVDLLGAAEFDDTIAWWENVDGSGTNWLEHIVDGSFNGACDVATADVDGDGDIDVLGAAADANDIAWWENIGGAGTNWTKRLIDANFPAARAVVAEDIDGDGDADAVGAAFTGDNVTWWENVDGSGTSWSPHVVDGGANGPDDIFTADIDGDGDSDIAAALNGADQIVWWANLDGVGGAWATQTVAVAFLDARAVHGGDIDGDGDTDLAGAAAPAESAGRITWWENLDGLGGAWTERDIDPAFDLARDVHVADLDRDGDPDVLGVSARFHDVTWWENIGGAGTTWGEQLVEASFQSPRSVIAADIDGDGSREVAGAAFFSGGRIAWWKNLSVHRGAAFCRHHPVGAEGDYADFVVPADVDRDGDLDAVGASRGLGRVYWWENGTGTATNWSRVTVDASFEDALAVHAADIDNDGRVDVVGGSGGSAGVAWWSNASGLGTSWVKTVVSTNVSGVQSIRAGDLDRDGATDLLAASADAGVIRWWRNDTGLGTTWTERVIATNLSLPVWAELGDLDGDGDVDVVGAEFAAGQVRWWENLDGMATLWTGHLVAAGLDGPRFATATDLDGDGDADILGTLQLDHELVWWENVDGQGSNWLQQSVSSSVDGALTAASADMDLDGDHDVAATAFFGGRVAWWQNLGPGATNWRAQSDVLLEVALPVSVSLDDLDRDGDPDMLLGAAVSGGGVSWWENASGHFLLSTSNMVPETLLHGGTNPIFSIGFEHLGRPGDADIEWTNLELRFERAPSLPLTSEEANALFAGLALYLDDGSGAFEPGSDGLVTNLVDLLLVDGHLSVDFGPGDAQLRTMPGERKAYFLVGALEPDAGNQLPNTFLLTHVMDRSALVISGGRDLTHDIPLELACDNSVTSEFVQVITVADLVLSNVASPVQVSTNGAVTFTVSVSNRGPDTAVSVVVTDSLPAGVVFDLLASTGPCIHSNGIVVCDLETIAAGEVKEVVLGVDVLTNTTGFAVNWATATTLSIDSNTVDNASAALINVLDTDGDGVPDFVDPDRDGDGMPNMWEEDNSLDPVDPADAVIDTDLDTQFNIEEYIADTDPQSSNSYFRVDDIEYRDNPHILFETAEGRVYSLQYTDDPIGVGWSNVPGRVDIPGHPSGEDALNDINPLSGRLYRLRVKNP